jgi:zinc D-Ala-D-Ala carboxypeptidase
MFGKKNNEQLSENFTLKEYTASQTATRLGIDNTPNGDHLEYAKELFKNVIQPVREHFGITRITSGYRCKELNEAIGGSQTSQHSKGQAVDFECDKADNLVIAQWIRDNLKFDQLISEFYETGDPSSGWIHVSWVNETANRGQCLTAQRVNGKVVYSVGLPAE